MENNSASYFKQLLSQDVGFLLLRLKSAPFILSFLYKEFRKNHNQTVLNSVATDDLAVALRQNIEEQKILEEEFADEKQELFSDLQSKADYLIRKWCRDDKPFLSRDISREGVAYLQLASGIERLFNWLEDCEPKEFVGTQSRFMSILTDIRRLKLNISEKPEERIAQLEKEKAKINAEIKKIKETNQVEYFSTNRIQEELENIRKNSIELLSDFKSVEDNFYAISKDIYKNQADKDSTKGKILGYTLDAEKKLYDSAQGQSFFAFWNFILQDTNEEIYSNLDEILKYLASKDVAYSGDFLLALKKNLYERGNKIVNGNRDLSDKISRVLAFQNSEEKRAVSKLITEIKSLVTQIQGDETLDFDLNKKIKMEVEGKPAIIQNQYLVCAEKEVNYSTINTDNADENISLDFLYNQFFVDEKLLKENAKNFKNLIGRQFTLCELLQKYPVQKGLSEIATWIKIADENSLKPNKDFSCRILEGETESIEFQKSGVMKKVTMPKVVFL